MLCLRVEVQKIDKNDALCHRHTAIEPPGPSQGELFSPHTRIYKNSRKCEANVEPPVGLRAAKAIPEASCFYPAACGHKANKSPCLRSESQAKSGWEHWIVDVAQEGNLSYRIRDHLFPLRNCPHYSKTAHTSRG